MLLWYSSQFRLDLKKIYKNRFNGLYTIFDIKIDIQGFCFWKFLQEFLLSWEAIESVRLQPGVPDKRLSPSEKYTTSLAYAATFQGSVIFEPWEHIWKTWAPQKCDFFFLSYGWLHITNVGPERLAKRNIPHPNYVYCVIRRWKYLTICLSDMLSEGTSGLSFSSDWGWWPSLHSLMKSPF